LGRTICPDSFDASETLSGVYMMKHTHISTLFLDIGGVLLTNGWDHNMRQEAAERFGLDYDEMNDRHHMTFSAYEEGKLTIDEYLDLTIFYKQRSFDKEAFKDFIFSGSRPLPEMIELFKSISKRNALKVSAISNEGRELTVYRIDRFGLRDFIQFFICSCFVHYRKPDKDIYRLALDVGQVAPEQSVYVDDRLLHVEVARSLGMNAIHHTDIDTTKEQLSEYGLMESAPTERVSTQVR
jgi:putative hydrolase of the HAD superfamily